MKYAQGMSSFVLASSLSLALAWPLPTRGQSAPTGCGTLTPGLVAEVQAIRGLYLPDGPLVLRFTLRNCSDEPIEVPLDSPLPATEGVALPLQLALGSSEQRTLTVYFEKDTPREVQPPATAAAGPDGLRNLRLAAHGAIGADIDIRAHDSALRYPGSYRVEWRPLAGQLGIVSTQFRVDVRKDAIIVTDYGKITIALDYENAPRNVENFLELVGQGFYDGKTFHRLVAGWLLQGGCPNGDRRGIRPDGKLVAAELHDAPFDVGTVAMARKPSDLNSASCQFFIGLGRDDAIPRQYTIIGQARDDESVRTLQHISTLPVDRESRPLSPLKIGSIKLVDAGDTRVRNLDRNTPTSAPAASSAKADSAVKRR